MGITGLLPFLKKIHTTVNIAQFKGCTVAIDAYCWLHKGAFSCAEKLALKEETDQYVTYCLKYVDYILRNGLKPIMVFDGCHLESKAGVEKARRERRELNRKMAARFLREGKRSEARDCLQKCVDITPQMALKLMKACRNIGVDCIVAPYEADAQLAFLNLSGIAQIIVTEDSDLLLFGCEKVIFKMDLLGTGVMIEKERLNEVMAIQSGFYTFDKFRHMCILSGCDYLPSLHGIGLAKANKVFKLARQGDLKQLLKKLPTYLKMNLQVSDDYVNGFIQAENTFLYQLVYDPLDRSLKPLNPYPPELEGVDLKYAGHHIAKEMAYQIALGNIDIHNKTAIDDYDPDTFVVKHPIKAQYRHQLSIWNKDYSVKTGSPCKEIQPSSLIQPVERRFLPKTKDFTKKFNPQGVQDSSVLSDDKVMEVYETDACPVSPKVIVRKRQLQDGKSNKTISRATVLSDYSYDVKENEQMSCDENETPPPVKKMKEDISPFERYNAANIGEETFKEGSPAKSEKKPCTKRNIFAVTKTEKKNLNSSCAAEVKSKYFASSPSLQLSRTLNKSPGMCLVNKQEDLKVSPASATKTSLKKSATKEENLKPPSLKDVFKKLKEKSKDAEKPQQQSQEADPPKAVINGSGDCKGNKQQSRTLSAFSWSKFKFSTSKKMDSPKEYTQIKPVGNGDSFSESLKESKAVSQRQNFIFPSKETSDVMQQPQNLASEETPVPLVKDQSKGLQIGVKMLQSQSYESFLKSMSHESSARADRPSNGSCEDPEAEESDRCFDAESPFPHTDRDGKVTDESLDLSSQEHVIDLTDDLSQKSRPSSVSSASNLSGRSACRVSGLSKKKSKSSKKSESKKPDTNQKSIKDLFSKFSYKRNIDIRQEETVLPPPPVYGTADDEEDVESVLSDSDLGDVDLVRRKLNL